eukprot:10527681-Alexandrium_andersonii.AAC.1
MLAETVQRLVEHAVTLLMNTKALAVVEAPLAPTHGEGAPVGEDGVHGPRGRALSAWAEVRKGQRLRAPESKPAPPGLDGPDDDGDGE